MDGEGRSTRTMTGLAADVLVDILLRLPPSCRRRSRLVCLHWRHVVNTRTAEMQSRPKVLVDTSDAMYLIANPSSPSPTGRSGRGEPWNRLGRYGRARVIGTCNGLICLWHPTAHRRVKITVVNPVAGDALDVPLPPSSTVDRDINGAADLHLEYSFAYHPVTGRYKVVHAPCWSDHWNGKFLAVQVYTLGSHDVSTWRSIVIPAPAARCDASAGIVSVNGVTYWITYVKKLTSLELNDESITTLGSPLDTLSSRADSWHLTEVRGRVAIVIGRFSRASEQTEVWVLEDPRSGEQQQGWTCRYIMQLSRARLVCPSMGHYRLPHPYFVHGERILMEKYWLGVKPGYVLYGHNPNRTTEARKARRPGAVDVGEVDSQSCYYADLAAGDHRTFAYVETTEPLSFHILA